MKKCVFFIMGFLLFLFNTRGQSSVKFKGLSVGEKVPDIRFSKIINYKSTSASLSSFRNKLIIVDFWATWCTSCVHHFPVLQQYQDKFGDKLQILLVNSKKTGDQKQNIRTLFAKQHKTIPGGFRIPSVIGDVIMDSLFPHHLLPHYVWISSNGTIAAITGAEEVTGENIQRMLDGEQQRLNLKVDMDLQQPLFLTGIEDKKNVFQSAFVKGNIPGLPTMYAEHKSDAWFGKTFANKTILDLYLYAANGLYPSASFSEKKTQFDAKDTSALMFPPNTYQLLIPPAKSDSFYTWMLQDLNRVTGFYGRIEKCETPCLLLIPTAPPPFEKIISKGGTPESALYRDSARQLINLPIAHLIECLNDLDFIKMPVVNETGYTGNIDIRFDEGFHNLDVIKKQLRRYDLTLIELLHPIDVLVLSGSN